MRGEVFQLVVRGEGHGQRGPRFAVVLQPSYLPLSTMLIAPTSTSARPAPFRPEVSVLDHKTLVLCEQTTTVDVGRLTRSVGVLSLHDKHQLDDALRLLLDL